MYNLIWEITRALFLVCTIGLFMRFVFIGFDYLESFQGRVNNRLFACRKRWFHRFTKRGTK